jgi:hypothetical protein
MNLESLKWTKNVNHQGLDKDWAYQEGNINCKLKIFLLNWNKNQKSNASKPKKGEVVILRQHKKVTHIAKFLNNTLYDDRSRSDFGIGRLVQVNWITDDWNSSPEEDEVFCCQFRHLQGGNIMEIETLNAFQEAWKIRGGLLSFQKHIQKEFKLEHVDRETVVVDTSMLTSSYTVL